MTLPRAVARERTAISRSSLSVPVRRALDDRVIDAGTSVLDYGCGRGDDVMHLNALKVRAVGWDPHYRPRPTPGPADVVLLTYVLNVIDDLSERQDTLRRALTLARRCLVVSTRLRWDQVAGIDHGDGVVTSRNTFQALHRPHEFRLWAQWVTGVQPFAGGPETVYLFTSPAARLAFVHRRFTRNGGDPVPTADEEPLEHLVHHLRAHGRMPSSDEDPRLVADLRRAYGSPARARRAAERVLEPGVVAAATKRRRADLVVALAMDTFHGRPRLGDLPVDQRTDIRAFFGAYTKAYRTAEQVLAGAGRPGVLQRSMRSARTGKVTPTSLYIHVDAVALLPPVLRIYEACAQLLAGRPDDATIVRLRHDRSAVSYLDVPRFDAEAHPEQRSATHVDVGRLTIDRVDYARADDPPVLHRREEFVAHDHPQRSAWVRQTAHDVAAGLYDDPALIGTRSGWQRTLSLARGRSLQDPGLDVVE